MTKQHEHVDANPTRKMILTYLQEKNKEVVGLGNIYKKFYNYGIRVK